MPEKDRTEAADDRAAANARREWSDAELAELGDMPLRGLSVAEIARLLHRDHADMREKVVEVGRAYRGSGSGMSERARISRVSPGHWRVEKHERDGRAESAVFGGSNARKRAIEYAKWRHRDFEEVRSAPMS